MEVESHGDEGKLAGASVVTAKEILGFSTLAPGNPGSSFRHMQVTILVFGLEKQLWLCFTRWPVILMKFLMMENANLQK